MRSKSENVLPNFNKYLQKFDKFHFLNDGKLGKLFKILPSNFGFGELSKLGQQVTQDFLNFLVKLGHGQEIFFLDIL